MKNILLVVFCLTGFTALSQNDGMKTDWANLEKYAEANSGIDLNAANYTRVVFMGNSITEFWKPTDSSFFLNNNYIDRGISGQTTPQMLVRFRSDVINLQPRVVVILAGINDIAENTGPISLETVFGNIVSMVELASANKIKVVLCSILPAVDFPWKPNMNPAQKVIRLNAMLQKYAKEKKIVYVDYFSKMVDEHQGLNKLYSGDGVHPNLEGYKIMEPLVQAGILKAIKLK